MHVSVYVCPDTDPTIVNAFSPGWRGCDFKCVNLEYPSKYYSGMNTRQPRWWLVKFGSSNGTLTKYVKLRVAHAPGIPGTFCPPLTSKGTPCYRSRRHHCTCVTHVPGCILHVGIASPRWQGKRSWHSRRMHNPQFYVSGKRPMAWCCQAQVITWTGVDKIFDAIRRHKATQG